MHAHSEKKLLFIALCWKELIVLSYGGIWQEQYSDEKDNVQIVGFIAATEEECRNYFASRVLSKLVESDGTEELKQHIVELGSTGFGLSGLLEQIQSPPKAKDWEIGEAFAEIVLEDEHEAMFPWPTNFDKRTPKASLPGADLVGLQCYSAPRFVFGQVKSSSEDRVPPQIVNSTKDCLQNQIYELRHSRTIRQQLISWLMVRVKDSRWEDAFNEALKQYSDGNIWLVGILVSGKRSPKEEDFLDICKGLEHDSDFGEIKLMGFYLPFHKDEWVDIVYGKEVSQ